MRLAVASRVKNVTAKPLRISTSASWPNVRFGDVVCDVKATVDRETAELTRFIAGEHMGSEDLHLRTWGDINGDYLGPAFHRSFRKGQVLYGSRRTYLKKVAVASFDGICANTTFVLESRDPGVLLPELLPFIMLTDAFTQHSIRESKGSVNPYINWKDIAKYEFPLPPKEEQRRIADILWATDGAESNFYEAIPKLRLLQKISFREMQHRDHNPQSIRTVGDVILRIVAGSSPNGSSEPATEHEYGVLKVSAAGEFGYVQDENKALINPSDYEPELEVQPGFLLVTRANALRSGVGRACIVHRTRPGLMLCDKTLRLVEDPMKVRKRFLLEVLRSRMCRNFIEGAANGTEAKNISQERLRQAPIWLPSIREQDEALKVIEAGDDAISSLESHTKSLRDTKSWVRESQLSRGSNNVR